MILNEIGRIEVHCKMLQYTNFVNTGTRCINYFLAADLGLRPPVRGLYSASEGSGITFFALSAFCCNRIYRNMNSKHIISKPNRPSKHRKEYLSRIYHIHGRPNGGCTHSIFSN